MLPLDQSLLKTSLRGYQTFGAKFALVQERVIMGDEMGLGKTMQSLAAMCHLAAEGATHFLVVCPASVVINWTREIERHTLLEARRLHLPGAKRQAAEQEWAAKGGVAITTFEALRAMPEDLDVPIAMMVVDEAHYAKNPNALRTQAVSEWASRSRRALFLTGTPMENKVEEFRVLVGHLRPDVAENLDLADEALDGTRFRERVAPVYLRRNQEDVLSELPDRLETEEWVALEGAAMRTYRKAVQDGNFMAMRRAAFDPGTVKGSQKLRRLVEIAGEAADGGRKVIVFSYFRDVLETVAEVLAGRDGVPGMPVIGPLTGDIAPADRQAMVDELTNASGPAVLVSQIQAGGVGLNIQAASVVVIAEPQLTPSIEEQAIARAHRMGQVRPLTCTGCSARTALTSGFSNCLPPSARRSTSTRAAATWRTRRRTRSGPAPRPNWGPRSWPRNAHDSRWRHSWPRGCQPQPNRRVEPVSYSEDRLLIRDLIENWALYRDSGDWERFASVWHDDARMNATWFQGPYEDFIAASRQGAANGVQISHFLGGMTIDVREARAVAQTKMTISQRGLVHDVIVDVVCAGRFYDFLERRDGRWGIVRRQPIYEIDRMDPVDPAASLRLDPAVLDAYPEGYRHLAYLQRRLGFDVKPGLPGRTGAPVEQLYAQGRDWLG